MLKFTFHPKGMESIFQHFCIIMEGKYLTLMEAVALGIQHGNDTLIPFDFITSIGKAFDTPLIAIKGFYIELEDGEYKSIKIDFNK